MVWWIREGFGKTILHLLGIRPHLVKSIFFSPTSSLKGFNWKKVSEKAGGTPLESTKPLDKIDWFRKPSWAITLCGMALLTEGRTPSSGPYRLQHVDEGAWLTCSYMMPQLHAWHGSKYSFWSIISYIDFYLIHTWISRATRGGVGPVAMTHRPML